MPDYEVLEPSDLSQETFWLREKLWFNNIAENLPLMRSGKNSLLLRETCAGPCVVVGAGPSVERFKLLEQLRGAKCHVIATDRSLVPLLEKGVVPEYVLSVDGDPKIAEFYDNDLVRESSPRISMLLAGQVHPSVAKVGYQLFKGVYWFNVLFDDPGAKVSISRAIYWITSEVTMAMSYGNVGSFAWSFADFLGHRTIILVGLDFSYGEDVQPMQTDYWSGFLKKAKGRARDALKFYRWETNPFGRKVLTDAVWDGYLRVIQKGIEVSKARTVNCSPLSTLHCPKVAIMPLEQALQKFTLRL